MTHTPSPPDKCDFCGLRVFYLDSPQPVDGINSVDSDFAKLRQLKDAGIIDAVPSRKIGLSIGSDEPGSTAFCAINAPAWRNKQQKCEHWSLKIKDAGIADYMAMHQTQRNNLLALWISIVAIVISVLVAIVD